MVKLDLDILSFQYKYNIHNKTIDSILLTLHPVETLNDYIPCYRRADKTKLEFEFIEVPIIQWYLSIKQEDLCVDCFWRPKTLSNRHISHQKHRKESNPKALSLGSLERHQDSQGRSNKVTACTHYIQYLWREYKRNRVVDI